MLSTVEWTMKKNGLLLTKPTDRKIPVRSLCGQRNGNYDNFQGLRNIYKNGNSLNGSPRKTLHYANSDQKAEYTCDYCKKSFKKKSGVVSHIRMHTNERPFQCSLCLRRFNHVSNLNAHMQLHTGNWKYKCNICTKGYSRRDRLLKHVKSAHPFPVHRLSL
mmetsp:Transcript_10504/g.14590  ORF Transcript_10504/g.14590 Transcript_10504/m.14590 type:complete len:161 (+) Transcript_10504:94-576(+)